MGKLIIQGILLILVTANSFAQATLTGRVIDAKTGIAIKGAEVMVDRNDSTVVTNVLGYFHVFADTSDYLIVSAPRFETSVFKVPEQDHFVLMLEAEKEKIYRVADQPAAPVNGFDSFKKHLIKNFACSTKKHSGEILVSFQTDREGALQEIDVLEITYNPECEVYLLNLLSNTPNWTPALHQNHPVIQEHQVKIIIRKDKIENVLLVEPQL